MYFIKKIVIDEKQSYQSSKIVAHCPNTDPISLVLERVVKTYVKEELGREASEQIKFLDIKELGQVSEPMVDGMLAYRIIDNPNHVHIYQRKTIVTKAKNWTWGERDVPVIQFRRTDIFEVEEYTNLNMNTPITEVRESINIITSRPRISMPMGFNLIDHLKKSAKFQARFQLVSQSNTKINDTNQPTILPEVSLVQ